MSYTSIAEACKLAKDEDVIEVRHDGPVRLERASLPIRIEEKRITLRGAQGAWPILQVVTYDDLTLLPHVSPKIFTIEDGGAITLEGLEIELGPLLPQGKLLTGWRVFEIGPGGMVKMNNCWMTVRNRATAEFSARNHDDFFVAIGDANSMMGSPMGSDPPEPILIDLRNVVVRGGDTLVATDGDAHVALSIDNGLIALRGYLFDSSQRSMMSQGSSEIFLSHVTADLGEGGLRIPYLSRDAWLQATVQDSVLLGRQHRAFVEHEVSNSSSEIPLVWQGDRNRYIGWDFIHRQQVLNGKGSSWPLSTWQAYWKAQRTHADQYSSLEPVFWQNPRETGVALFDRTPDDYLLDLSASEISPITGRATKPPGIIVEAMPRGTSSLTRLSSNPAPPSSPSAAPLARSPSEASTSEVHQTEIQPDE
jgi:hypothetical protein